MAAVGKIDTRPEFVHNYGDSYAIYCWIRRDGTRATSPGQAWPTAIVSCQDLRRNSMTASWVNSLVDSGIKSDMLNFAADGVFTDAEAIQLLADVANRGSVTANELNSLQLIAANLNSGLSTSDYVSHLFNQLVDGNPANATWTGGGTAQITLGNLQVGTTSTQMSELIGKWFQGTDLPDPTLPPDAGGSGWTLQGYSAVVGPLYSSAGAATVSDICQGADGDCELMSGLIDVVVFHPQVMSSMIVDNGNGTYGVRFYVNGQETWETVNDEFPVVSGTELDYGHNYNEQPTAMWVALVEKAYAQLSATGQIGHPAVNSYNNISADPPTNVFENLTDATSVNYYLSSASNWYSNKSVYIAALSSHDDVILEIPSTSPYTYDSAGNIQLVPDHAFGVVGYDSATGNFIVRNPWGNSYPGQNWDVQFEVSLTQIASEGGDFVIDNSGAVDVAPTVVASNVTGRVQTSVAASSMFYTTGGTLPIIEYALWDSTGNGHFTVGGVAQANGVEIDVAASQWSSIAYQFGPASDQLWVEAFNGVFWSAWSEFTATPEGPVVTAANVTATHGQSFAVSSLFTYYDPFGLAATEYDVWDSGTGGGHFVLNGVVLAANQHNYITAAQLSSLTYQSGSGADTLWIRANDSTVWGQWSNAFTVTAPVDSGPVEAVSNIVAAHGQSYAASSLFTYSDPFNSPATLYDVWDKGTGGGHFVLNGVALPANQDNYITPAQLASLSYQSGSGIDTLWIRANDGTVWGAWSSPFTVNAPLDSGPVETVSNIVAPHGQSYAASSLFTYSDPFNSAATEYDVWDSGTVGGSFLLNGVALPANQDNYITAAQLASLSYQSGSGIDTLWIRANDGTVWGAWSNAFTVNAPLDSGPVETVSNIVAPHGQSYTASSLFTYSDPFNSAATEYDVWDSGTVGGSFLLNGVALPANQDNYITAAQLASLSYQSGSGIDTLWIRANDGTVWGAWSNAFTVNAPLDSGPVETVSNIVAPHGQSYAASSLFTYSDPFNSAATQYDVWDTGTGGGHFVLSGVALAPNQHNYVTAAQLASLSYQSGSGADTLWVRANDGTVWGSWSSAFTVTAPVDTGPVVTPTNSSTLSVQGQTFSVSSLFTYSDPFSSSATSYDVWNSGGGNGYFTLNGVALGANQDNVVAASQLSQLAYHVGSGTDTLWIKANDGTVWGAWSSAFTISDPSIIPAGQTLELASASSAQISFASSSGTLKLDDPAGFSGTVAGMTGADAIDFANIDFAAGQTVGFAGNAAGGSLSVSDGVHAASIALLGNYMASTFVAASDGHGGTAITVHPDQVATLAPPQHA
ncbi:C2 family cysteine protease [uncultured Bradyrhizobium sp.]|uniref:C2 family cysteine protease n=1 Tax=uncultured Bradyrhizobium sp. TaxID=199684 RepID=UPI0026351CA5|nr:C2 family cysteine protease [uncultured Bradyrhizobium sp.]